MKRRWPSAKMMSKASVDLPDPDTPVTTENWWWGIVRREVLQVVFAGAGHDQHVVAVRAVHAVGRRRFRGQRQRLPLDGLRLREGGSEKRRRGGVRGGDSFGRAFSDDLAAVRAGIRPDLEQPVGAFQHVEIVLDHDEAVSAIDELLQDGEQPLHVVPVQSRGRFVEQQQRAGAIRGRNGGVLGAAELTEIAHQFQPLRLAAAQRVQRLAERQIAQARPRRASPAAGGSPADRAKSSRASGHARRRAGRRRTGRSTRWPAPRA